MHGFVGLMVIDEVNKVVEGLLGVGYEGQVKYVSKNPGEGSKAVGGV